MYNNPFIFRKEGTHTEYWIVRKGKDYISYIDEYGRPSHTKDPSKAWKFYNFDTVSRYLSMGYCAIKNYD